MKIKNLKSVDPKEFDDIYYKNKLPNGNWRTLFKDTLSQIENFSSSIYFWYVADFNKGVVQVGGNIETATPLRKKEWIGLNPWDIGKLIHPLDEAKMRSFIVFIAEFLASKTSSQRKKIKISLIFRMVNSKQQYTWRSMEYPAMHYVNNQPRFLLCYVKELNHLLENPKCVMYLLDSTENEPTMFYCEDERVQLKQLIIQKQLSSREIEIVKLLADGLISKEIGKVLNISKNTVENHKQNIYLKTGTKKINELITYANRYILNENVH